MQFINSHSKICLDVSLNNSLGSSVYSHRVRSCLPIWEGRIRIWSKLDWIRQHLGQFILSGMLDDYSIMLSLYLRVPWQRRLLTRRGLPVQTQSTKAGQSLQLLWKNDGQGHQRHRDGVRWGQRGWRGRRRLSTNQLAQSKKETGFQLGQNSPVAVVNRSAIIYIL